jgi:DNA polymerase-3 subunit epsilon
LSQEPEEFVVLDTETTGRYPASAQIVQLAAIRVRRRTGGVIAAYETLVCPGIPIPDEARAVHGIDDQRVAGSPALDRVWSEVLEVIGPGPILGHNALYDLEVMCAEAERHSLPRPASVPVYCTLGAARRALPLVHDHKLGTLSRALGLPPADEHQALGDVLTTLGLWRALCRLYDGLGFTTLDAVGVL